MKKLYALVLSVALLIPAGCATNTGTGAIGGTAGGAAAGALMGQIIGQNTKSTLLGKKMICAMHLLNPKQHL